MRVVIYGRYVRRDEVCEKEIAGMRTLANQMSWAVMEEIIDTYDEHSLMESKHGMGRVIEMCKAKEIDAVMFFSLDRLTLEGMYKTCRILMEIMKYDVKFHAYAQKHISTLDDESEKGITALLNGFKRQESIDRSMATRKSMKRMSEKGIKFGRPPIAYAYIQKIREWRDVEGLTYGEIAKRLKRSKSFIFQLYRSKRTE